MIKHVAIALLAAGTAVSVWAQQAPKVVGKFANVTGVVLVSTVDASISAANGVPFAVGSRVVATASGGATLKFDNGCELTIKANESVIVDENAQCKLAAAAVPPSPSGAGAAGAGSNIFPIVLAGGAVAAVVITQSNKKTSGS